MHIQNALWLYHPTLRRIPGVDPREIMIFPVFSVVTLSQPLHQGLLLYKVHILAVCIDGLPDRLPHLAEPREQDVVSEGIAQRLVL